MNRPTGTDWLLLIGIVLLLPIAMFVVGVQSAAKIIVHPSPKEIL